MNEFTLLDNIELNSQKSLMKAFNAAIRLTRSVLKGDIHCLDSTIIETKPDFPGCGKTAKKDENGDPLKNQYIYGFKLFVLYEIKSRIIVAQTIVPANESDQNYFLPIIKQGIHNCGKGKIKVVTADRGFLCGKHLWELKYKLGIDFVIPAKKGMTIREDAIALNKTYENKTTKEWKYGKGISKGYGVDELLSYLEYSPPKIKNNRSTNGNPLNAVVVTTWRGKPVDPSRQTVLLTSLPAEKDASEIAKTYRLRSYIENSGFRELKQAAFLSKLPRKKGKNAEKAAYIHIMLCVFAHTLFYAFLGWRNKQEPKQSNGDCLREWRRRVSVKEDNKILIIAKGEYALYEISELLDILGVKQKQRLKRIC